MAKQLRRLKAPPRYTLHRATGQARVVINGRHIYLGPYDSAGSKQRYGQLIAELAVQPTIAPTTSAPRATVLELIAAYWTWAVDYYRKPSGEPTGQQDLIRLSLRPLRELYGDLPANKFSPLMLDAVRRTMISSGRLCRKEINRRTNLIRGAFKWGVSKGLVKVRIWRALTALDPLRAGHMAARERPSIKPVAWQIFEATLPFLPQVLSDAAKVQRYAGCRPGEILAIRPADVDRSLQPWRYTPATHKNEHLERQRVIYLGPKAQAILAPYLLRSSEAFCFSPADNEGQRKEAMRANRKSPVQPSQQDRRRTAPRRKPREQYDRTTYRRAIVRAVERANRHREVPLPRWHPNQLRHAAATELREKAGIDVASTVLGLAKPDTTLSYAEADRVKAANNVVLRLG